MVNKELTYRLLSRTQSFGIVSWVISAAFLSSTVLTSWTSFFTKALIPSSFLCRVRTGTGGTKSSLSTANRQSHCYSVPREMKRFEIRKGLNYKQYFSNHTEKYMSICTCTVNIIEQDIHRTISALDNKKNHGRRKEITDSSMNI